jgi:hypothetical protein
LPTPGFPAGTLDDEGDPIWIRELAAEDPNHLLYVIRGLSPDEAVTALGGSVIRRLEPGQLPERRPDPWTSLGRAVVGGHATEDGPILVAGRSGDWTFVYDDSHAYWELADGRDATVALSEGGCTAASSGYSINADTDIQYAVDGRLVFWVSEPHQFEDVELPTDLLPAAEAAGVMDDDPDADYGMNMRVVCALAGLMWTTHDLRNAPLVIAGLPATGVTTSPRPLRT